MRFKLGPIDFTQPSTWRGLLGLLSMAGITLSPELAAQIAIALGAGLSAIELFRNESAVHSPRPLAGEGPGVRVVDSTTDPLTLTLSPKGEGTQSRSPGFGDR